MDKRTHGTFAQCSITPLFKKLNNENRRQIDRTGKKSS